MLVTPDVSVLKAMAGSVVFHNETVDKLGRQMLRVSSASAVAEKQFLFSGFQGAGNGFNYINHPA
jgi:hypothetical protein